MADEIVTTKALMFGKYDSTEVVVNDGGLAKYIDLTPTNVPHSGGKHANRWFGKSKLSIVERLINNIMRTEKYTGKKLKAYKAVEDAFAIVAQRTKQNPIQVLVQGLENAAPREEVTRLQFGGISVPKAVDVAPQRRLDIALRNLSSGVVAASSKNKKPISTRKRRSSVSLSPPADNNRWYQWEERKTTSRRQSS